ncbi:MAG: TOBE domain-containing protein [Pseudomonadota bacterium]
MTLPVGEGLAQGRALTLGLRPEHVALAPAPAAARPGMPDGPVTIPAQVLESAFFGTHHRVRVAPRPAGPELVVHLPQAAAPRAGDSIALAIDPDRLIPLPQESP